MGRKCREGKEKAPRKRKIASELQELSPLLLFDDAKVASFVIRKALPATIPGCKLAEMQIKILGSAAGGAFPQWNCACSNCRAVRAGTFRGKARSQTQVAISADGLVWFLLGASPDLRAQIEATIELHPKQGMRHTPIAGIALANADVDHVLGLLLLRELQPLRIHSTASVRRILREDNSMFGMLHRIPDQTMWTDFESGKEFYLRNARGEDSSLRCRAWSLSAHYPAYVTAQRQAQLSAGDSSLGFFIHSNSGTRLAYMPAVPQVDDALLAEFEACDVLLFDGTFWSDDELMRVKGGEKIGQTARQMGHVAVEDTLVRLAGVRRPRKMFLHINNTNPMLDEASPQYRQVREAGWEVAEDGWQFNL